MSYMLLYQWFMPIAAWVPWFGATRQVTTGCRLALCGPYRTRMSRAGRDTHPAPPRARTGRYIDRGGALCTPAGAPVGCPYALRF